MPERARLESLIRSGRRLVVFLHDNPDPDTIASGWLMARIGEHLGPRSLIVHGGHLGRAENRSMVKLLRIPLRNIEDRDVRYLKTDRYALVDTQPGAGNNSFPERLHAHIIVDHHPSKKKIGAEFLDIRPEEGCCTTQMLGYYGKFGLHLDGNLATAAAYAILSETQDLRRETTRADREAYQRLAPLIRQTLLGRIRHPVRPRGYYRTVARAMQRVRLSRNTCVCHIGPVPYAEVVAEIADFLVNMERVSWCLVSGLCQGTMTVSIRATRPHARAEQVIRRMLRGFGKGGGHGMIAGGAVRNVNGERYTQIADRLNQRFLKQLNRRHPINLCSLLKPEDC